MRVEQTYLSLSVDKICSYVVRLFSQNVRVNKATNNILNIQPNIIYSVTGLLLNIVILYHFLGVLLVLN